MAIVVGKLLSALVYLFLLIAASIPLMAVVFVFGGVAPEDVLRGYIVLLATAIGLGSFGIFCSSVVKRTTAATAISIFGVLAVTIGTVFVLIFWTAMGSFDNNGNRVGGLFGRPAPAIIAYLNPFIAQADVMCGTESTMGFWCGGVNGIVPSDDGVIFTGGSEPAMAVPAPMEVVDGKGGVVVVEGGDEFVVDDGKGGVVNDRGEFQGDLVQAQAFGVPRDTVWPKSVATYLILSAIFLFLSVQLVSPTRRWRLRRGRRPVAAPETPA